LSQPLRKHAYVAQKHEMGQMARGEHMTTLTLASSMSLAFKKNR
jgi:hypothetical protein